MKRYHAISYKNVRLLDGFWKNRLDTTAGTTAQAVYDRFAETHRIEALECKWKEGMEYMPHIFWDSDVAKWIEGAAYIIAGEQDATRKKHLEALCDNAIEAVVKNQTDEGYFNSHYLVMDQNERFTYRDNHELYCAGHFMEAGCAYYEATGKDLLLKAMCKYADYIYDVFYVFQTASFMTSGHEEIELALVRLYETVGDEKYLQLSKYFLDKRGNNRKDVPKDQYYRQDHLPLKQQHEAEGHCVRAMYLYSAMADVAAHCDDAEYLEVCKDLYADTVNNKMYITGGIGNTNYGEAFAKAYYLPNDIAYTETCAAIGLALFCKRMLQLEPDARYADTIERVIYNGALSGISLDGKAFFYTNPLEIDPYFEDATSHTGPERYMPLLQRLEVFGCSCCPPNILRFLASIGELLYTCDEKTLFVNQFMASQTTVKNTTVTQTTAYPAEGALKLKIEGSDFEKVAVRIPGWCSSFKTDQPYTLRNGYACFEVCGEINLNFEMQVVLYEANAAVQNNAGCVAVTRGPVVYCMEEADNGKHLRSLSIVSTSFKVEDSAEYGAPILSTQGRRKKEQEGLYSVYSREYTEVPLRFIPYFAFANRGVGEMLVWTPIV